MDGIVPNDELYMAQALALAEASVGLASPNPQVGCVLVRDEIVLAEGAHLYDQRDHAETVALKQAAARGVEARGATAYVTLEPCSHHGRTGPRADALIAAGIARCVVATVDPNPLVSGQGIARMRAAGIEIQVGVLQSRARTLNNAFALSIVRNRPFVTLKTALSVDGRIAPAPSQRVPNQQFLLTGPQARADVQRLRHASDAILFGIGTVLADDPLMTDRTGQPRRHPLLRVLLDSSLRIPMDSKLVASIAQAPHEPDLWIFCNGKASRARKQELESRGALVTVVAAADGLDLVEILAHLYAAKIISVLVEAGSAINGSLLRHDLVDKAILFYAETELGPVGLPFATGTDGPFALEERMLAVTKRNIGADVRVSGLLHDPWTM